MWYMEVAVSLHINPGVMYDTSNNEANARGRRSFWP